MSIHLRDGYWHIYIVGQNGKKIRRSARTKDKAKAQELHDKLKHELWKIEELGERPKRFWDEACVRWLQEKEHKKSLNDDIQKIKALTKFRGMILDDITRDFIMHEIALLKCSNATRNRYLSLIRSILNRCSGEWEWIDKAPKLTLYKEAKKRIRWLTKSEAQNLLDALPPFYADLAEFSFMTGLRQSNVLSLEWSQVDLDRRVAWIHADQTKSGLPLGVPLNNRAIAVLRRRQAMTQVATIFTDGKPDHGLNSSTAKRFVFLSDHTGRPVKDINSKVWKKSLAKAGIDDFRWHDIRHTWASWLVQSGVPLLELKEMGGWESTEMVQKYAHLAPQHLHKNADLLNDEQYTFRTREKNPQHSWQ